MGWVTVIASALKLAVMFFGWLGERNRDIKEAKKEALKEGGNGWKTKDVGRIHSAWERSRRLR